MNDRSSEEIIKQLGDLSRLANSKAKGYPTKSPMFTNMMNIASACNMTVSKIRSDGLSSVNGGWLTDALTPIKRDPAGHEDIIRRADTILSKLQRVRHSAIDMVFADFGLEHKAYADSTTGGGAPKSAMYSYTKDQIKKWNRTLSDRWSDNKEVARLVTLVKNSNIDGAISQCDKISKAYDVTKNPFVRDVDRMKGLLQQFKRESGISHSYDLIDMVTDLFMLEHGDDKVSNYIEI